MEIGWTLPQLMLLIVPISLIVLYAFVFAEKYTDESHSEFIVRKKEQAQISSRSSCKHSYYDMKTQEPINKTTDYLFAYKIYGRHQYRQQAVS